VAVKEAAEARFLLLEVVTPLRGHRDPVSESHLLLRHGVAVIEEAAEVHQLQPAASWIYEYNEFPTRTMKLVSKN
jgi:hypothetical protein